MKSTFILNGKKYTTEKFTTDDAANKYMEKNKEWGVIGVTDKRDKYEVHLAKKSDLGESKLREFIQKEILREAGLGMFASDMSSTPSISQVFGAMSGGGGRRKKKKKAGGGFGSKIKSSINKLRKVRVRYPNGNYGEITRDYFEKHGREKGLALIKAGIEAGSKLEFVYEEDELREAIRKEIYFILNI